MPAVWPIRKTSGSQRLFEAVDAMHWKQLCSHWRRGLAPNGAKGAQEPKRRQTEGKFQTGAKQNLDSAFPVETWPGAKRLALAPKAPNAPNDCAKRAKAPNRRQTEGRRQTGAKQPWSTLHTIHTLSQLPQPHHSSNQALFWCVFGCPAGPAAAGCQEMRLKPSAFFDAF